MRLILRSLYHLTWFAIFAAAACSLRASDCDGSFNLDSTHLSVVFNNQKLACYNWQVSYFSSGFSAVNVIFESAPNGVNANSPGAWSTFTALSGNNPSTAITQNTTTFSGSFPWVRVRLASSTGTGQVTGRMLGAQLTSATAFPNAFSSISANAVFGTFHVPVASDFSWVDQGAATVTNLTDGFILAKALGAVAGPDILSKRCATLPASPWTVITAWINSPSNMTENNTHWGLLLQQTGGGRVSEFARGSTFQAVTPSFFNLYGCTSDLMASCTSLSGTLNQRAYPVTWERVVDNGVNRTWSGSLDGVNWTTISNFVVTAGNYAAITPTQACIYLYDNDAGNWSSQVKVVSWQLCSGSSGTC